MDRLQIPKHAIALLILGGFYSPAANLAPYEPRPAEQCSHLAHGTTQPNTSGSPKIINPETGTVISANFFNSGSIIYSPYFDGNEFVSVCVIDPDLNEPVIAEIGIDVGLKDDTLIKAYPEFIFGSKFGNQFETSFRYYDNTGLPLEHQWPVTATNLANSGQPFKFANLEYVSQVKGIGLPAFTNALPQIDIVLNMSEENVVGAERDVMLESWFYDTSANAALIGNNTVTGQPIANTLNNIVSTGHRHFDQLNNTLLEMMVHLGPLSQNDISNATRNPGQFQLTEIYSGLDYDGDGIDDHFDVDSHINVKNSQEPRPGKYSSGVDANGDGIDDADILPVTIGDYQYSIWYGTTYISPLVIYSRETNLSLTNDFDPLIADMNLSAEGDINLDWNLFLDYTINDVQAQLQTADVFWANGPNNLFDKMKASGGAIGGLEIGVEPQINNPTDEAYTLKFEKLDVTVDGIQLGLTTTPTEEGIISDPDTNLTIHTSCLASNGRVDINVVNNSTYSSEYQFAFGTLPIRSQTVPPKDWGRVPITGRSPGIYSLSVYKDSRMIYTDNSISIDCSNPTPPVSLPEITAQSSCRNGLGQVFFQFVNPTAQNRSYIIEFESVTNRSTTALAFGQSRRGITGRPDGIYDYTIHTSSPTLQTIDTGKVSVECSE